MKRALSRKNIWEHLPSGVKGMVGAVIGTIPFQYLLGGKFRQALKFVDEAQWKSEEWYRDYQLKQLKKICTLAAEKSPFYQKMFKSAGFTPGDLKEPKNLSALPLIDRDIILENNRDMCTVSINSLNVDYVSTGGTSGVPMHFYIGADRSVVEFVYLLSSWRRCGYDMGSPLAVFRGRVVSEDSRRLRHQYDPVMRYHCYSNFHMTDQNMQRYLDHIRTIGPCYLHVYPSSSAALTRFVLRSGTAPPENVRGIIAESEIVYPDQREQAEKAFSCRFFSCYGHSEKLILGVECEYSSNYHIWPTYGYFELIDDQGRPVTTPGQRGQIVGTGFINKVMPFIRYKTGDYATYVDDHCRHCSREHPVITDIQGHRIQEVLVTSDGSEISWTAMNMHDDTFANVRQFQFFQDTPGRAILRLVPSDGFSREDCGRIMRNLGKKFDQRLAFTIEMRTSIPLSPRGKAIYVDQQIIR